MTHYLRTDEQHDVYVSLCEVLRQLRHIEQDINAWKWAIIALTSAVNGSLVCNLSGTMQVGALTDNTAEKAIAALQKDSDEIFPKERLGNPHELFQRATGKVDRIERAGPRLFVSPTQIKSFERLFELRNQFIHFKPTGWSIETTGLPMIFLDMIQIIQQVIDDGWSFRHLDEPLPQKIQALSSVITEELKLLSNYD